MYPTRSQCLAAARVLRLVRPRGRDAYYLVLVSSCLLRPTARGRTLISMSELKAGAALIAAQHSVRDLTAACRRASELSSDYVPAPDALSYSETVSDLALLMLRNGWRRRLPDDVRAAAENNALVDYADPPPLVFVPDSDPDLARYAAENNAAWEQL